MRNNLSRRSLVRGVLGGALLVLTCSPLARPQAAPATPAAPSFVQVAEAHRLQYLANAVIWRPGPVPTPDEIRQGPAGRSPVASIAANAAGEIPCTYVRGGAGLNGRTAKFTCRTESGRTIRVKYYDGNVTAGNREVFAEVAATRLFWALGFDADAMYPVTVLCADCPANPMAGSGPRATRRFAGVVEAFYDGVMMGTDPSFEGGWRFGVLRDAIATLPAGPHRDTQLMHVDALRLLAAFVQHGDRKPSQQRLVCRSPLDLTAGDLVVADGGQGPQAAVLAEHDGASACSESAVTVQDLGATFGGAGQFTLNVGSKMHLAAWASRSVFTMPGPARWGKTPAGACLANLTASNTAGAGADQNPIVSEAGRQFLYDRLAALTPEHVRAIFEASKVLELDEPHEWQDPHTHQRYTGIDAWVAVFRHKVEQIAQKHCGT
jgi:hypothetical protein